MVYLWICAASAEYGIAVLFAKRGAIRRNVPHFHGKRATVLGKALQSLDCGTLQDDAHSGSVAHTEE